MSSRLASGTPGSGMISKPRRWSYIAAMASKVPSETSNSQSRLCGVAGAAITMVDAPCAAAGPMPRMRGMTAIDDKAAVVCRKARRSIALLTFHFLIMIEAPPFALGRNPGARRVLPHPQPERPPWIASPILRLLPSRPPRERRCAIGPSISVGTVRAGSPAPSLLQLEVRTNAPSTTSNNIRSYLSVLQILPSR